MQTGIDWCQYGGGLCTLFDAAAAESVVIFLRFYNGKILEDISE